MKVRLILSSQHFQCCFVTNPLITGHQPQAVADATSYSHVNNNNKTGSMWGLACLRQRCEAAPQLCCNALHMYYMSDRAHYTHLGPVHVWPEIVVWRICCGVNCWWIHSCRGCVSERVVVEAACVLAWRVSSPNPSLPDFARPRTTRPYI